MNFLKLPLMFSFGVLVGLALRSRRINITDWRWWAIAIASNTMFLLALNLFVK